MDGVFIHKDANAYEDQRTIIAKRGEFVPAANKNYLKLILYSGYIFEDNLQDKDYLQRLKQIYITPVKNGILSSRRIEF